MSGSDIRSPSGGSCDDRNGFGFSQLSHPCLSHKKKSQEKHLFCLDPIMQTGRADLSAPATLHGWSSVWRRHDSVATVSHGGLGFICVIRIPQFICVPQGITALFRALENSEMKAHFWAKTWLSQTLAVLTRLTVSVDLKEWFFFP